ncbi:magnesium chelatase domain-containing protein [Streptomyces sp. NPDC019990]|uniref:magnesium chelatase domain-containing protein n=1 Tax=Streptomyces sp. NPDC019990 TaxID=3154693 RepID=UPI00340CF51A
MSYNPQPADWQPPSHTPSESITGIPARPPVLAANHWARALRTPPQTDHRDPLSRPFEDALETAARARRALQRATEDRVAQLVRQALPTAAAVTIDTDDKQLNEVLDADGATLWNVQADEDGALDDRTVDDIDDCLCGAVSYGGFAGAGWKIADKGEPYRTITLPPAAPRSTATARFPARRAHREIRAEYTPGGIPAFDLDGLDDECIRETRDRIRAAIVNSRLEWEPGHMRITAHWTVASGYSADLALACTALAAAGAIDPAALDGVALIGELGLDGRVRPVRDVAVAVRMAVDAGFRKLIVAAADFDTARRFEEITPVGVANLAAALVFLKEMHEPTTPTAPEARPQGTPGEDAGNCAQCDRLLIWDGSGKRVNDEWGEYMCYGPRKTGSSNVHVLAQ